MAELNDILAREHAVWAAMLTGDLEADANALSDDFLGVYPQGFSGKADHVDQLKDGASIQDYSILDARLVPVGPGYALLTYRADYVRRGAEVSETMFVSSLWKATNSGWINTFSQDTPALAPGDAPPP